MKINKERKALTKLIILCSACTILAIYPVLIRLVVIGLIITVIYCTYRLILSFEEDDK